MQKRESKIYVKHIKGENDKKTIIFSHGDLQNHTCFSEIVKYFKNMGHPVILFDLPGHGLSKYDEPFNNLPEIIQNITNDFSLKDPIMIGHSSGGILLADHVMKTKNASSLLIINSPIGSPVNSTNIKDYPLIKEKFISLSKTLFEKQTLIDYFKEKLNEEDIAMIGLKNTDPRGFENNINFYTSLPTYESSFNLNVPVLIIASKNDNFLQTQSAKLYESKLPNSKLYLIEGGHNIHITKSLEIVNIIKENYDFLLGQKAL